MNTKVYKPLVGGLFWGITIPTAVFMIGMTVGLAISYPPSLFYMTPICLLIAYFLVTPLFGYVELRTKSIFIRFGFFVTREIPYDKVRGVVKERKLYSDSMLSLKNAMEHLNIKYDRFDMVSVSVVDNDGLMEEIEKRRNNLEL